MVSMVRIAVVWLFVLAVMLMFTGYSEACHRRNSQSTPVQSTPVQSCEMVPVQFTGNSCQGYQAGGCQGYQAGSCQGYQGGYQGRFFNGTGPVRRFFGIGCR